MSFSSLQSSSKDRCGVQRHHALCTDSDSRARLCTVKLYRRPLVAIIGYHWALYFEWNDGYDMHYEATDVNGVLVARCARGKPETHRETLVSHVCTMIVSPKRVNDCAKQNCYNGERYVLTKMNCQVWAKQLADDLNISLPIPVNFLKYVPGSEFLDSLHGIFRS